MRDSQTDSEKPLSEEGYALMGAVFEVHKELGGEMTRGNLSTKLGNRISATKYSVYMRISRQPVGYLVNFGPINKVMWKRFVLSEFINRP